jgi:predicted homoserine dehydrogenase-like protein
MKAEQEIQLGIIGSGSMGKGVLYQSHITSGVRCAAICDLKIERCIQALREFGLAFEIADSQNALEEAVRRKNIAVCESGRWIAECEALDAVLEASSAIGSAAEHSIMALEYRKHLILMNSEIDLMFGPLLHHTAGKQGVVCTSCDGDQYGVLKHLIDDIKLWGFELVMAGNIKGYLDRYATPTSIIPEADQRALDYRMCTSYTDGTKLNIEMAIVANACDLTVDQPGMSGPRLSDVQQVLQCFDFVKLRENPKPVVDYILGAEPGGGVFVVGYCGNPYQQGMLSYYKMGAGPFYLFYRPYHLCHIEAMAAVVKAVRQKKSFLGPSAGMRTNVFAYAKRHLKAGATLDGIGGYECYGMIENLESDSLLPGVPIALAEGVTLNRAVARDERISMSDIVYDPDRLDFALYAQALAIPPFGGDDAELHA